MIRRLKSLLPEGLWKLLRRITSPLRVYLEFAIDGRRYLKYSSPEDKIRATLPKVNLNGLAIKEIHKVEKGLALKQPKRPFGLQVARKLGVLMNLNVLDQVWQNEAHQARNALDLWNSDGEADQLLSPPTSERLPFDRAEFHRLFESRRSVRQFDEDREVPHELLFNAARLAGLSPSVCNRQAWKVFYATTAQSKSMLRANQNGNLGFGEIPVIALVVVDIRYFEGAGERNQGWIDGGIFSMSLCLALHGLGLATCMLNLSLPNSVFETIRSQMNLGPWDLPIMMVAVGYAPKEYRVARSTRKPISEICSII